MIHIQDNRRGIPCGIPRFCYSNELHKRILQELTNLEQDHQTILFSCKTEMMSVGKP